MDYVEIMMEIRKVCLFDMELNDKNDLNLDDLTLFDGSASPSAAVFGNQWRLDKSVSEFNGFE